MTSTPPVRRRLVGGALRWYREHLGYTLEDAARILDCDRSKISRIETGQRGIRHNELRDLLTEYGIGEKQQVILTDMANPRHAQGWYTTYADLLPGAYQDYLILEAWASRISAYEAQRIPELLQTPAYARALAEADPGLADDGARDRAAGATLARQKAILGERRPDFHVVIGEAALRQEVGGQAVMRSQLEMLARISGGSAVGRHPDPAVRLRGAPGCRRRLAGHLAVLSGTQAGSCLPGRRRRRSPPGRKSRPGRL